jgi:hypothetical protein
MTKTFQTTFVAIGLSLGLAACAGEKTSRQAVQPEVVQVAQASAPAEKKEAVTKRVCIDRITKDGKPVLGKDGKPLQDCREMKIHKKLEGTVVPTK